MLSNIIFELARRLADVERRLNNIIRPARVVNVDPEKGLAEVAFALDENDEDVTTIMLPWVERAGKIKTWEPPSVDEQVILVSPSGEIGASSWIMRGGFTDKYPKPHNKEGEYMIQIGNSYILHKEDSLEMHIPGNVKVTAQRVDFEQGGGGSGSSGVPMA